MLKHYCSSDSEGESSSVDKKGELNFEKKPENRPQTKTFAEMLKKSKRYKLLHREENMAFKPVQQVVKNVCHPSRD